MLDTILINVIMFCSCCVPAGSLVAIAFAKATSNWSDLYIILCTIVASIGIWLIGDAVAATLNRIAVKAEEELK